MTTTQRCTLVTISIAVILLTLGVAEAGTDILMIPAAAFSADGTNQVAYINYGDSLETSTTLHFHAWVNLPDNATITNVDMMTRDDDVGTITGYLKRTEFGADDGTETLLTFTSPGNLGCSTTGGLCHDMASLLEIEVDAAGYGYWFDLVVPDAVGSALEEEPLNFYALRIMYEYQEQIFADGFETGDTSRWSSHSGAKSVMSKDLSNPLPKPTEAQLLASLMKNFPIEDPEAREAMKNAVLGKAGYGSPYVVPGPGFKTAGYIDYDDYYFSESYGFVYGRPSGEDGAILYAPVNLPDGADIAFYFAFFVDSVRTGTQANIRFWLSRMDAADIIPTDNMVYEVSDGRSTVIQAISVNSSAMETAVPGSTIVNNAKYSYWLTLDVGPYDLSPPDPYQDEDWWHKVYSIVILYTMP